MQDQDDEPITLRADTLAYLAQFMNEQKEEAERFAKLKEQAEQDHELRMFDMADFKEDWQLSQFWYTKETSYQLAMEALA